MGREGWCVDDRDGARALEITFDLFDSNVYDVKVYYSF